MERIGLAKELLIRSTKQSGIGRISCVLILRPAERLPRGLRGRPYGIDSVDFRGTIDRVEADGEPLPNFDALQKVLFLPQICDVVGDPFLSQDITDRRHGKSAA